MTPQEARCIHRFKNKGVAASMAGAPRRVAVHSISEKSDLLD
jgi:hypothetical protein